MGLGPLVAQAALSRVAAPEVVDEFVVEPTAVAEAVVADGTLGVGDVGSTARKPHFDVNSNQDS